MNWVNIAGAATVFVALLYPLIWKYVSPVLTWLRTKKTPASSIARLDSEQRKQLELLAATGSMDPYFRSRQAASDLVTALLADKEFELATQATQLAANIGAAKKNPTPTYTGTKIL